MMWLVPAVALFVGQEPDPGLNVEQFGAFGIVITVLLGVVWWLARQLAEERKRNDVLNDRIIDLAERSLPTLTETTAALRALSEERIEREREDRRRRVDP